MMERINGGQAMITTDRAKVQHLPEHVGQRYGPSLTLCGKHGFFRSNRHDAAALPLCSTCERRTRRFVFGTRELYEKMMQSIDSRRGQ